MAAILWHDVGRLAGHLSYWQEFGGLPVICTSGGFDPLHVGHLRCLQACKKLLGIVVVIVNGDGFLKRKKGYAFMPLEERMEIVAGIAGIDHVVSWDDGSQFVFGALEILKPNVFAKGGDRSRPEDIAPCELEICQKINCKIEYGVGGFNKVQSSSDLVLRSNAIKRLSQQV